MFFIYFSDCSVNYFVSYVEYNEFDKFGFFNFAVGKGENDKLGFVVLFDSFS